MNKIASNIQILLPFFRRKGKKISRVSIINNRYVVHNKFNPVIFPSQVSSKISRRLLYIFFFFFFTDDSNSNPAARNPIFLPFHYSPPLLPSSFNRVEIIVFNIPFLLPLYAPMVDISDKTREPCLILTEEREREWERKRAIVYFFGLRGVASIFRWRRAKTSGTDKRGLQIVPLLPKMETALNILCRRWLDIDWFFAPFPRSFN